MCGKNIPFPFMILQFTVELPHNAYVHHLNTDDYNNIKIQNNSFIIINAVLNYRGSFFYYHTQIILLKFVIFIVGL